MIRESELEKAKDVVRGNFIKYTRNAFRVLPHIDKPKILDIGCGSGMPSLELARLCNGKIIGVDIDKSLLEIFKNKIENAELSDRVQALECSMFDLDFPNESFDIIWAEGSISVIGFGKGIREWKRFLKTPGYLVVHDEIGNIEKKLSLISNCGYELLDHFLLYKEIWWNEYFAPLEKRLNDIVDRASDDINVLEELDKDRREIEMIKKKPDSYGSAFFIMRKI